MGNRYFQVIYRGNMEQPTVGVQYTVGDFIKFTPIEVICIKTVYRTVLIGFHFDNEEIPAYGSPVFLLGTIRNLVL